MIGGEIDLFGSALPDEMTMDAGSSEPTDDSLSQFWARLPDVMGNHHIARL